MSESKVKRTNVKAEVFTQAYADSVKDGTGINGIITKTGMSRGAVQSRLVNLRKSLGKENCPALPRNGGNRLNKDALLAILNPEVVA